MKKNTILIVVLALVVTGVVGYLVMVAISAPTVLGTLNKAQKNTCVNQFQLSVSSLKTELALGIYGESEIGFNWDTTRTNKTAKVSYNEINKLFDTDSLTGGSVIITEIDKGNYKFVLSDLATKTCKIEGDIDADKLTADDIIKNK